MHTISDSSYLLSGSLTEDWRCNMSSLKKCLLRSTVLCYWTLLSSDWLPCSLTFCQWQFNFWISVMIFRQYNAFILCLMGSLLFFSRYNSKLHTVTGKPKYNTMYFFSSYVRTSVGLLSVMVRCFFYNKRQHWLPDIWY